MKRARQIVVVGWTAIALWSCSGNGSTAPEGHGRNYQMGFSFYPTVFQSAQPQQFVMNFRVRADLVTVHWDGNIPWPLLAKCPDLENCDPGDDSLLIAMHANLKQTVQGLVQQTGFFKRDPNKSVYLAVSPLNIDRDAIVNTYAGLRAEPPGSTFAAPEVTEYYNRFVTYMVTQFEPDYFTQVIEINMYAVNRPDDFMNLVRLAQDVFETIKTDHPLMPTAPTIQWEFYKVGWDTPGRSGLLDSLASNWYDYADFYAFSTYPNIRLDQTTVDSSWYRFDQYGLGNVANSALMISECGIQPLMQRDLLRTLSRLLQRHNGIALNYFFLEDMDHLDFPPSFRDVGLYHDKQSPTLTPHPGLAAWDSLYAL
ncbi:MAG: hypothetical protein Kow0074_25720 [Candidatus Zixiibacteriota bacterium]